jgi:hypothetical protein
MSRLAMQVLLPLFLSALIPSVVLAQGQGTITGVIRDTSGGVLPGVTVEAASPALIEKVRTVVTDGSGQYRIVDLRPGTYVVTATLTGFNTVRREGIEMAGGFTATVNLDMRVGALEETITVTGESPIVDVQSTRQQQVVGKDVIDTIPTARSHIAMAVLVPGIGAVSGTAAANQDVGGARGDAQTALVAHGSRASDQRVVLDGLATNNDSAAGARTGFLPNMSSTQEIVIDVAAGGAESPTGGVRINVIPREGGNRFTGTTFFTAANSSFVSDNYSEDLRARGLRTPSTLKNLYDFNPGVGGPIVRDKLWFFVAGRKNDVNNYVGAIFENKNAGDPTKWLYEPDLDQPMIYPQRFHNVNGRLTWQVNPRHKVAGFYQYDYRCQCPRATGTQTTEASTHFRLPLQRVAQATYSSPLTSRLLVEAGGGNRGERWMHADHSGKDLIGVTDQATGISYRGASGTQAFATSLNMTTNVRASLSYVTGAHAFKVGIDHKTAMREHTTYMNNPWALDYRFNNGVPNQLTQHAQPFTAQTNNPWDTGVFVQDRWTVDRLTVNGGLRFEYFTTGFPEQHLGPSLLVPDRNLTFPAADFASWTDLAPRLGAAYDLFGDGRTAVKISLNKYMVATGIGTNSTFGNNGNPIFNMANAVSRSWTDADGDFVPDCDLLLPTGNGECGAMSNANFGKPISGTRYDPDTYRGWGKRPYNWEFSTGIQHELIRGVSLNVAYYDRWYGNTVVTDNLAVTAADFGQFGFTAPANPLLPGGGGYAITGLYNLNQNKVGLVDNYLTFAKNYGEDSERWRGGDISVATRLAQGVMLQGGFSTGRTSTNNCEVRELLPETGPLNPYCDSTEAFQHQVKFVGSYTIPRIDVQASAAFQSFPGPQISASFTATNAIVSPSLGRPLSGGAQNVSVNIIEPGALYGERLNQLDLRFSKLLRFGVTRSTVSFDLYNALNANTVLAEATAYGRLREPINILLARFARISLQLDF